MTPAESLLVRALAAAGVADPADEVAALVQVAAAAENPLLAAQGLVQRRLAGEPLAYLTGRARFMTLDLVLGPGALVPREETELLGYSAIEELCRLGRNAPRVIDMCCGIGNLACAIARHVPTARVWASDVSVACVALATRNAGLTGVSDRVDVLMGDLFSPLEGMGLEGMVDVVVCNPPYISQKRLEADRAELLKFEPREAFDGGPFGFSIQQRVVRDALTYLRPGGAIFFEVGLGQHRQVRTLFQRAGGYEDIRDIANANDEIRVVWARKKAPAALTI